MYLRTILHELGRMHSHLLWLGFLADGFGFESLFQHCWRIRETVLDLFEETRVLRQLAVVIDKQYIAHERDMLQEGVP